MVHGNPVVLWDAVPRTEDKVVEGAGAEEIIMAIVEERLREGAEAVDDVLYAGRDMPRKGGTVKVIAKTGGGVCEGGGMLGEIVGDGDGGGVGGGGGPECEGELGDEGVDEREEGVEVGEDEAERGRRAGRAGAGGGTCGGAGVDETGECVGVVGGHGCVLT